MYPRGNDAEKEKSLSVYLEVQKPPMRKFYVEFKLRVVDQLKDKNKEKKGMFIFLSLSQACLL